MSNSSKIFYGWWVVTGLFFATFFGTWGRYIVAALIGFIHEDAGWTATQVNLSISIALWVYAAAVILVGRLVDTWGGRRVIITGSVLLSLGFIGLSLVTTLGQLYLAHGVLLAVACAMTHAVPTQAVARKWFIQRSGLVGGLLASAFAISQSLLAPVLTYGASIWTWRAVSLAAASFDLVVLVLALLVVRDTPESMGLRPYGAEDLQERPAGTTVAAGEVQVPVTQALHTTAFWAMFFAYGFLAVPLQGVLSNIVNWGNAVGISMAGAGLAATAMHLSAIPGKMLWGALGDRLGKRLVQAAGHGLCLLIMLGGWLWVHDPPSLYVFAVCFGLSYGVGISLIAPYLGDLFGRQSVASLFGVVTAAHGFIGGFGPLLWGLIFDATGTYNMAALTSVGIYILVIICFYLARPSQLTGRPATSSFTSSPSS